MDWNSFFSTLAQSIAAVIGLFGAFVINTIFGNEKDLKLKTRQLIQYVSDSELLRERAVLLPFASMIDDVRAMSFSYIIEDINRDGVRFSAQEYLRNYGYCPYDDLTKVVKEIQAIIDEAQRNNRVSDETRRLKTQKSRKLVEGDDSVHEALADIKRQISLNNFLLLDVESVDYPSPFIKWSLVFLLIMFLFGVIYPISFIPTFQGEELTVSLNAFWEILFSLKGVFLSFATISYSALLLVFWMANSKQRVKRNLVDYLRDFTKMSKYHYYFGLWSENRRRKITEILENGYGG